MEKRWGPHHFTWPRFRLVDEAGSDDHTEDSRILVEISPTCYLPNSDTAHICEIPEIWHAKAAAQNHILTNWPLLPSPPSQGSRNKVVQLTSLRRARTKSHYTIRLGPPGLGPVCLRRRRGQFIKRPFVIGMRAQIWRMKRWQRYTRYGSDYKAKL